MEERGVDSTPILAAASLFAGLCKFTPVPILDKILLRHLHRHMIASLLTLHDIKCEPTQLYPLYKSTHGCFVQTLLLIFIWPFILIYKIFINIIKWLFFILVIREAAIEMGKIILLGHTIERCLVDGRIPKPSEEDKKSAKLTLKAAKKCKKQFNKAFKGSDLRFLVHLFKGVLISLKRSPNLIKTVIRVLKEQPEDKEIDQEFNSVDLREQSAMQEIVNEIVSIMKHNEMQLYIKNFDQKFDAQW